MLPPENAEQLKETKIQALIEECLAYIDSYKNGIPPKPDMEDWAQYEKHYHNRSHTNFVMQEIDRLFQEELKNSESHLKESDKLLCKLLAGTHDYDQQENSSGKNYNGGNEKRSVKWLVEKMQTSGQFTDEDIEIAKIALLATWTPVVGKGITTHLRQLVKEYYDEALGTNSNTALGEKLADLPSHGFQIDPEIFKNPRAILIAQLLADADLATLGNTWPIYWENMVLFFREQHPEIKDSDDTPANRETWKRYLGFQVNLLNNHRYHTQAARDLYLNCVTNSAEVSGILANDGTLSASFEAMLQKNGNYRPTPKAMGAVE